MSKSLTRFKHYLLASCFFLLVGLTGCSSDDVTSSVSALPSPSMDCDGSSCID